MKRTFMLIAALTLVAGAPSAVASAQSKAPKKPSPRAKLHRATLADQTPSDYISVTGRAQLVDGKKVDNLTITLKGLAPNGSYTWDLHEGGACDGTHSGTPVTAFTYKPLTANAAGNASSKATAKAKKGQTAFSVGTKTFTVTVHDATGAVVACGVLNAKKKPAAGGPKKPPRKPALPRGPRKP